VKKLKKFKKPSGKKKSLKAGRKFKFATADAIKKRIENIGKGRWATYLSDTYDRYKIKQGDNFIRLLPLILPEDVEGDFAYDIYVHSRLGANSDSFVCVEQMWNDTCELCHLHRVAAREGDEEMASELRPYRRSIGLCLDVHPKRDLRQSDDILVIDMPASLADEIARHAVSKETGAIIPLNDPDKGRVVIFEYIKGKTKYGSYGGVQVGRKFPVDDDILDAIVPVEDVIAMPDEKVLQNVLDYYERDGSDDRDGNDFAHEGDYYEEEEEE